MRPRPKLTVNSVPTGQSVFGVNCSRRSFTQNQVPSTCGDTEMSAITSLPMRSIGATARLKDTTTGSGFAFGYSMRVREGLLMVKAASVGLGRLRYHEYANRATTTAAIVAKARRRSAAIH